MSLRMGVDLGQSFDPTAIAAVECIERDFAVRQVRRIELGTPYPRVAEIIVKAAVRMREIDGQAKIEKAEREFVAPEAASAVIVYVDATGVGAPVVDMLIQPLREAQIRLVPVTIAAGDELKQLVKENRGSTLQTGLRVGKEYLVGRLQALLQSGRISGEETPEFKELQRQLAAFQRVSSASHDTYGAKSGSHDDLVVALGLAVLDETPQKMGDFKSLNTLLAKPYDWRWPKSF